MYYLYILKSQKDLGYYIGITDNPEKRLMEHNAGKTRSLKNRIPFFIFYTINFNSKTEARKHELQLKKSYTARNNLFNQIGFCNS